MTKGRRTVRGWGFLLALGILVILIAAERDRTELAGIALVTGCGLDWAQEEEALELTVELAHKPQNDSPGESRVFTVTGENWAELQENLGRVLDKKIYWYNAVLLTVGTDLLELDAGRDLLRRLYQDPLFSGELLLVATEDSVPQVFSATYGENTYISSGLEQGLRLEAKEQDRRPITLLDYTERVLALEEDLALPVVAVRSAGEKQEAYLREESYFVR